VLTDKNLLFTPVLSAARVRENCFFAHIHSDGMVSEKRDGVNGQVLPVFNSFDPSQGVAGRGCAGTERPSAGRR
jgi:hypothetical protein